MSFLNLKFTKGVPEKLRPGMVFKIVGSPKVYIVGHVNAAGGGIAGDPDISTIDCWATAIEEYELDWLGSNGIPTKAVA